MSRLKKKMKTVTGAIILKGRKVLLTRRKAGENLEGYWEFPGGKVEDGETLQSCLEREIYEELGVKAVASKVIAESIYEYSSGEIRLIGIETELLEENFTLSVHDRAEWIRVKDLLNYQLAPADIPIAEKIMAQPHPSFP